jgi:Sec-independent protein translocase protein TatA
MTVFGIGTLELMLILLLLILIFGPDRIVEMGKWLGRSYRKLTGVTDEINQQVLQVRKAIDTTATGMADVASPLKETAKDLNTVQKDLHRDLSAPAAAIQTGPARDAVKTGETKEKEATEGTEEKEAEAS